MIVNSAFQMRNSVIIGCGQTDTSFVHGYPKSEASFKWNSYRLKNIIKSEHCRNWNIKRNDFFQSIKKGLFRVHKKGLVSNDPLISLYLNLRESNHHNDICNRSMLKVEQTANATPALKNIQSNQYGYDKRNSKCNGYLSKCNTDAELRIVKVLSQSHNKICRAIRWSVLCVVGVLGYIKDLSKTQSVTLQRYCSFFVPKKYKAVFCRVLLSATCAPAKVLHTRYGALTQPNKIPAKEISWEASLGLRVKRPTIIHVVGKSLNTKGGLSHA